MDLVSPENIAQLTALLAEVSEDASHVLIAYFVIPIVMKLMGIIGWLLTLALIYKVGVVVLNKIFDDSRPKVVKVKGFEDCEHLFLGKGSWEKLMTGAEKYKEGRYISTVDIHLLLDDAAAGKALRLGE